MEDFDLEGPLLIVGKETWIESGAVDDGGPLNASPAATPPPGPRRPSRTTAHPAARASASEQNHRSPFEVSIRVLSYHCPPGTW